jgi:hypothetical protein
MAIKDQSTLKVGQKVHYEPIHYKESGKWENGIIKEIPDHTTESVRVVFNCGGDWNNYQNYTSQLTSLNDLNDGWKSNESELIKN